jgi:hypothetical protein
MRKILFVLVVGLILTSMTFGSFGKLNVWVRDMHCNVVKSEGHLHVFPCCGNDLFPGSNHLIQNGHVEINVPPGCYIIKAGMYTGHGNIYTDKTIIIVKCGKESCVNLVLPQFLPHSVELQDIKLTCLGTILPAFMLNAVRAGVNPGELDAAIDVMARAGRVDKGKLLDVVRDEIKMLEESMPKAKQEEQKEMREYLDLLKKAISSQTQKK